jgi:DNA-binding NarL/FixJ family response regulator
VRVPTDTVERTAYRVFQEALTNAGRSARALSRLDVLSEREPEALVLIGRGLSNAAAARTLPTSEATVKTNVSRMLTKLGGQPHAGRHPRPRSRAAGPVPSHSRAIWPGDLVQPLPLSFRG